MRPFLPTAGCLLALALLLARAPADDVRITELQTTNLTGIEDENKSHQGWIELWNPLPPTSNSPFGAISLAGYKLVCGPSTWTFPEVQIMPDERIVVWASGNNRTTPTAPLHTNFTLPAGGGTLQLLNASGTIVSQISNYPAQNADESWGRDEWDTATSPTQVGRYTKPTPAARNNYLGSGVAGKVIFDKASQAFSGSLNVTLAQASPDAAAHIYYTTNGAVPTAGSVQYSVPLTVNSTQMIRARVIKPGLLPGETETQCYLLLDLTTSAFNSPMPIMVVTNFLGGQPPADGDQNGFAWLWEPAAPDNRARMTNPPTVATRMVMDRRGSSTVDSPKYNTNFEARKARDDDDDGSVSFLGMAAGSDYVLSGPLDYDRSGLHNPFIFDVSRSIGRYAPDNRLIEVFYDVNGDALNWTGGGGGDYYGIYNFMEKVRRDASRVNVHKLDPYDNDTVGKTGGFIYKVDRLDTGDNGFSAGGQSMAYYYPKEREIKSPQRDPQEQYLTADISNFNTALQSTTWNNPVTGYAAYLDVAEAIDHHLLNTWPMNVDALRLSGYWHKERGGKLSAGPIWDFDRSMESDDPRDNDPTKWRGSSDATDYFNYTWWNRLFADIDFYQKYIDRWQELRRGPFSQTTVNALIDSLRNKLPDEAVARDFARWGVGKRSGTFPNSPTSYPATEAGEVQRIKDWLQVRAKFFDSQWVGPITPSVGEGNVALGMQVTLSGPSGATIYYTLDGADPRPAGGGAPAASITKYLGTPISVSATTRLRARAYNATWLNNPAVLIGTGNPPLRSAWSGLTNARYSVDSPAAPGNLVITEINYHPVDPTAAELAVNPAFVDSDFEFLELRNLSSAMMDLGGVQFTAGVSFTFSGANAISLAPGAFVIVAANPAAFAARYGAGATVVGPWTGDLDNGSEELTLKTSAGATIQDFSYHDSWDPSTDGNGYTLVVHNQSVAGSAYGNSANWRASHQLQGSPGAYDPNSAPIPNAGPDTGGDYTGISLTGTLQGGQSAGAPSIAWSQFAGPGAAAFSPSNTLGTSVGFSLPGVYTLRLTASDGVVIGTDDVIVYARDTAAGWLARHPGIGAMSDDFEKDGRINFAEFALGSDPTVADADVGLSSGMENGHLTLTYTRIKPPCGVAYTVEVADDPGAFRAPNAGEVTEQILTDTGIAQTVKATDTVVSGTQAKRFLRLKLSPFP